MCTSQSDQYTNQIKIRVTPLLDRQLSSLGVRAMARLGLKTGDRVADIGCGAGQTCLQLAEAVGSTGRVWGIDSSPAMAAIAEERTSGLANVAITLGDAEQTAFKPSSFDALYSRFGVMFFAHPVRAFVNLHTALKPGGALAFVCWRRLDENDLDYIPLQAALPHLPASLTQNLDAAAPFSLSNPVHTEKILTDAGFGNVRIEKHDECVSSGDKESMLELALSVGSLGKIVRENPHLKAAVAPSVKAALEANGRPNDFGLNAAAWIVSAQAA